MQLISLKLCYEQQDGKVGPIIASRSVVNTGHSERFPRGPQAKFKSAKY
jgi:hypothetical protein